MSLQDKCYFWTGLSLISWAFILEFRIDNWIRMECLKVLYFIVKKLRKLVNEQGYSNIEKIPSFIHHFITRKLAEWECKTKLKFKPKKGRYVGSLIETSRPICSHLIKMGNPISREQLTKVLDKYCPKGKPDLVLGRGMIEGTNIDNFSINKGGYQCRHIWIWIIEKWEKKTNTI